MFTTLHETASGRPMAQRRGAPSAKQNLRSAVSLRAPSRSQSLVRPDVKAQGGLETVAISTSVKGGALVSVAKPNEHDLPLRHQQVMQHFPTALGIDDFIARVEVVLSGYGFTGDNSIAMTNLCRDEVTTVMKDKIEAVFGSSFNTNGLGAVLTCGATGMGAGLSHSPVCAQGRERYVFFSFPHIAVDGEGTVGAISRPGRAGRSCACGALAKCLKEFQAEGYACNCKVPGIHDPLDPEYSILKQRLARRLRYERADVTSLNLASITAVAERTITNDLEYLIEKAIDTNKADYAVVTGVQVHNWATSLEDGGAPSMEFAAPTKCYVVVNGCKIHLDLSKVPSQSPRQLLMLAAESNGTMPDPDNAIVAQSAGSVLQEIPLTYLTKRLGGGASSNPIKGNQPSSYAEKRGPVSYWPSWQSIIRTKGAQDRDAAAPTMDSVDEDGVFTSFEQVPNQN